MQPADIAALVGMALTMPAHVDVTRVEVVPTMQVFGGSAVAEIELVFRIVDSFRSTESSTIRPDKGDNPWLSHPT